jgi:hypothetical protein
MGQQEHCGMGQQEHCGMQQQEHCGMGQQEHCGMGQQEHCGMWQQEHCCYDPGPLPQFSAIFHHLFRALGHSFPTRSLTRRSDRHQIT